MIFYPDAMADSVDDIPWKDLYDRGYRGVIFDIDNTLVPHGAPADEHAIEFFKMLRETGFDSCLISNNKEKRVTPFASAVGSKAVWKANKPSRKNYGMLISPIY